MPGANCCIVDCGSSRRQKGLGIFKLPKAINESYKKWREGWLEVILRTREADADFLKQIEDDTVHTCENHFKPEDLEVCKFLNTYIHVISFLFFLRILNKYIHATCNSYNIIYFSTIHIVYNDCLIIIIIIIID